MLAPRCRRAARRQHRRPSRRCCRPRSWPPHPSTHLLIEVLRRPLEFTPYTSAQLARFAREHNLVRSVGRTAVWDKGLAS